MEKTIHINDNGNKRVLILLSTYNGEQYLAEQLDSLLSQTYKAIDIAIRNDGSTDNTLSILSEYQKKNPRITVMNEENVGCARSFWNLLMYAKEKKDDYTWFAFCDQDDYWMEDKVAVAVNHLEQAEATGPCLYCSNLTYTDEKLNTLGLKRKYLPQTDNKAKALVESFSTGCTMVFNKALLEQATASSIENLHLHDLWVFHTCMFFGKIIYDPHPHILYRQHGNNEIGSKTTLSQQLHSKQKSIKTLRHQHVRETEARELLQAYGPQLSEEDRFLISFVATYRQHLKYRLSWLLGIRPAPKGLRMTSMIPNLFLKTRVLFGRV